jgi:hypothetical protein
VFDSVGEIASTYVKFQTAYVPSDDSPKEGLYFKVQVTSRINFSVSTTLYSDFYYNYPGDVDETLPTIEKIEGEGCQQNGKRALNCPTDGKYNGQNARITLWGTNFPNTTTANITITIDGVECANVKFDAYLDSQLNQRNASCEYGAGVSGYGTNGYGSVVLEYLISSQFIQKSSYGVRYFNYSFPNITAVSGCKTQVNAKHTANCTREGGTAERITIVGTNFGASGARAFVGGKQCTETRHDADYPHTKIYCSYPSGTRTDEDVWVMNSNGGSSMALWFAQMSYKECNPGQYQDDVKCRSCLAGSYSESLNSKACTPCAVGTYTNKNGSTECYSCPTGAFAKFVGSQSCVACPAGTYTDSVRSTDCKQCAAGEYNPFTNRSACTECMAGSFSGTPGSTSCLPCPPGYYTSSSGGSKCSACGSGTFNNQYNQSTCVTCADNSSPNRNLTECLCDPGYYQYDFEVAEGTNGIYRPLCKECSEGMDCNAIGLTWATVLPLKGYMPMINTNPENLAMIECINEACAGGTTGCQTGYTGILCAECDTGLGATAGHLCETCKETSVNALRLLGVLGIAVVSTVFMIYSTITTAEAAKSDMSTILKIGMSFLQFNSLALQMPYQYPPIVDTFLAVQEKPATVANGILSVDCFVKDNPAITVAPLYVKSVAYLLLPFIVCLCCSATFIGYKCKRSTHHDVDNYLANPQYKRTRKNLKILSKVDLPPDSKAAIYVRAWNNYVTAVIITLFMVHPSIVTQTFAMLNCKTLGAGSDDNFLVEDMSQRCWTSKHVQWVLFVAVPMLIFYVFGMPLFVLYRLYKNRTELTKTNFAAINRNVVQRYHFLFKGYEPEFYYWEIVIMIRKVLLVCITVFFSYDIQVQSLLATLLVVTSLCVHTLACPYITDEMDGLEMLSLFTSFCTYFFGQFLFLDIGPIGKMSITVIIVLSNLLFIVVVSLMAFGMLRAMAISFGHSVRRAICCEKPDRQHKDDEIQKGVPQDVNEFNKKDIEQPIDNANINPAYTYGPAIGTDEGIIHNGSKKRKGKLGYAEDENAIPNVTYMPPSNQVLPNTHEIGSIVVTDPNSFVYGSTSEV